MKKSLFGVFFLCVACFSTLHMGATAMNFQGSADEVRKELDTIFPLGTQKVEVESIATSKLGLDVSGYKYYDYGEDPLTVDKLGKDILVYSWIEINLAEYRSIKKLFIKTTVTAKFFFDKEDRLNGIEVGLYGDSL